jgi:4-amino-4-deoxychorismate lyase
MAEAAMKARDRASQPRLPLPLVDGIPADAIGISDRGLQYGDGLFETIAVVDGAPCLWDRHLARLRAGCARLAIPPPPEEQLVDDALRLTTGVDRAVLKVIVTRGDGGRGYRPPATPRPRRIVGLTPWPGYPGDWTSAGVRVRYCATRLGRQPRLAGLKHLNRLEQVLGRAEWDDPDVAEGLMLDLEGDVVEGTQANVFVWRDGRLLTPALDQCGVAGVVRGLTIDVGRQLGVEVVEARLTPEDLVRADALFLTSSLAGLWPVRELAGRRLDPERIPRELSAAVLAGAFRP